MMSKAADRPVQQHEQPDGGKDHDDPEKNHQEAKLFLVARWSPFVTHG